MHSFSKCLFFTFLPSFFLTHVRSSASESTTHSSSLISRNIHACMTVGSGVTIISDAGHSKTFPIKDPVTDEFYEYSVDHKTETCAMVDTFVGAKWLITPNWALSFGLDYVLPVSLHVQGALTQGADIQSENQYSYRYKIRAQQLFIEERIEYKLSFFKPFFLLGLGWGFNQARSFSTSVPSTLTFTREYQNHSNTSFSYAIGVGSDFAVLSWLRVGIGYRFADLGKVKLGKASIDNTPVSGTLSQSHLYANQVLGQITIVL